MIHAKPIRNFPVPYRSKRDKLPESVKITDDFLTAHEAERAEMADLLNENISQILVTSRLFIECAIQDGNNRLHLLEESRHMVTMAMNEINNLSRLLLPTSFQEIGLLKTINDLVDEKRKSTGVNFKTVWNGFNEHMPNDKLKLTILRIIQEYTKHIIRNTRPESVVITFNQTKDCLQLSIQDDGQQLDRKDKKHEVILQNIKRRALMHMGKQSMRSIAGKGNALKVIFPI